MTTEQTFLPRKHYEKQGFTSDVQFDFALGAIYVVNPICSTAKVLVDRVMVDCEHPEGD